MRTKQSKTDFFHSRTAFPPCCHSLLFAARNSRAVLLKTDTSIIFPDEEISDSGRDTPMIQSPQLQFPNPARTY
jgi:hypothetical protein